MRRRNTMSVNTTRIDRINYGHQSWYARRNEIINTRTTVQAREKESATKGWRGKREENAKGEGGRKDVGAPAWMCALVWGAACVTALSIPDNTYPHQNAFTYCFVASNGRYSPPRILRGEGRSDISFVRRAPLHAGWGTIPDRVRAFDRTTTTRPSVLMHERG